MNQGNSFLYTVSGIACILVVFIHVQFPGYLNRLILPECRFAVPFFFVLSGYFSKPLCEIKSWGGVKIKKFFILFISIWFCYLVLSVLISLFDGVSIGAWARDKFSKGQVLSLLLFNHSNVLGITNYTPDALWFLPAMAYVYSTLYLLNSYIQRHRGSLMIVLGTVLMLGQYLFTGKTFILCGDYINAVVIVDNWLFEGLFLFLLGNTLREYNRIHKLPDLSNRMFVFIIVLLWIMAILESVIHTSDIYWSNLLTVVFVFLYAERKKEMYNSMFCGLGKYLSANVYYWHVFVKALVVFLLGIDFLVTGQWVLPLIVLSFSVLLSYVILRINLIRVKSTK